MNNVSPQGPLDGLKVLEIGGVGPGPFAGMMLADMGADVLRIERSSGGASTVDIPMDEKKDMLRRGKRSLRLDLKRHEAISLILEVVGHAEVLFEGFRPGVMERLGLGPKECLARNRQLVYGRMTGWGQTGPLAQRVGHDINYIGLSGALSMIGPRDQKPTPPANLVGDFGGGGMLLVIGILAALTHARETGEGQVVDASMVEGSSLLTAMHRSLVDMGVSHEERGTNSYDGAAPFYDTYETADGRYIAVAAAEPPFYRAFVAGLGLDPARFARQMDESLWPQLKTEVAAAFRGKTQDEWLAIFDGVDACVTAVLGLSEAPSHPHNLARRSFIEVEGQVQPAPAPIFSRTPAAVSRPAPAPGDLGREALAEWAVSEAVIERALAEGAMA